MNSKRFAVPVGYYAEVLWELGLAEFRSRYARRSLTLLWWFIEPVLLAVTFFFLTLVLSGGGRTGASTFAEIFMRVVFWQWFRNSINTGMTSMVTSAGIVKQIAFPPTLLLMSKLLIELVNCVISIILVFAVLAMTGVPVSMSWLQLPAVMLLQFAITIAVCFWLATAAVFLQDTIPIVNFGLNIMMYLSPVGYRGELIPSALKPWMFVNPFSTLMAAYDTILVDGQWLGHGPGIAAWFAVAAGLGALGFFVFEKAKIRFYRYL